MASFDLVLFSPNKQLCTNTETWIFVLQERVIRRYQKSTAQYISGYNAKSAPQTILCRGVCGAPQTVSSVGGSVVPHKQYPLPGVAVVEDKVFRRAA